MWAFSTGICTVENAHICGGVDVGVLD